ncbi:hypothetical protein PO883_28360 [Massilia sp. DJPM01]|uniref:hypothetical protein n=1 Tax=Massilia sp. DJPM01 TaxID=3024404 RepID=UPI00259D3857|nr:hypothetical protein [Massilia sp. DJPM01]MDM5181101.1 hypothetical protein [Massilia sp. DJPM01]
MRKDHTDWSVDQINTMYRLPAYVEVMNGMLQQVNSNWSRVDLNREELRRPRLPTQGLAHSAPPAKACSSQQTVINTL